jgi:hypothetical protein
MVAMFFNEIIWIEQIWQSPKGLNETTETKIKPFPSNSSKRAK